MQNKEAIVDQESDFKKARDLLIGNFSIIDFDGDLGI
jgi:hypothetical protein